MDPSSHSSSSSRETHNNNTNSALNLIQILIEEIIMTPLTSTEASNSNNSNSNPTASISGDDATEEQNDMQGIVNGSCARTLRLISETERRIARRVSATSRFIPSDDEYDDDDSEPPPLMSNSDEIEPLTPTSRPRITLWNQLHLNLRPSPTAATWRQHRQRERAQDYPQPGRGIYYQFFSGVDQRCQPPPAAAVATSSLLQSVFPEKPPLIQMGTKSFQPIAKFDPTLEASPAKPRTNRFSLCHEKAMAAKFVQNNVIRHRFNGFGGDMDLFNRFWQETDTVERTTATTNEHRTRPAPLLTSEEHDEYLRWDAETGPNHMEISWGSFSNSYNDPTSAATPGMNGSGDNNDHRIGLSSLENEYLGQGLNQEMVSSMFRLEVPDVSEFVRRAPLSFTGTRNGRMQRYHNTNTTNDSSSSGDDEDDEDEDDSEDEAIFELNGSNFPELQTTHRHDEDFMNNE